MAFCLTRAVDAQRGGAAPRYKGILEPVSYGEDVNLTDAFFVTVDEGWVSGGKGVGAGVLLHTTDGGTTWTVALGDPAGSQRPFTDIQFVDQTTGFVVQGTGVGDHMLLRTTDGATWKVTGTVPQHRGDYRFVSSTVGVASTGHAIVRTTDAGRTWAPVFDCTLKVQVQGLTKNVQCEVSAFAFPTPTVGYAIGSASAAQGLYVFKTQDGGATWTGGLAVPGNDHGREGHVFFTNEKTGYACLANGKLFGTDDGAQTWNGLPGASCEGKSAILFADPEVGWTFRYKNVAFTSDGGKRWVARQVALPGSVNGFSLPRRDRGYVVGDHGMVYRYRVVPVETSVNGAVDAPAMPGFSTAIVDRESEVEQAVTAIESTLAGGGAGGSAGAGGGAIAGAGTAAGATAGSGAGADAPAPFMANCCGKRLSTLELVLKALGGIVPEYTEKYKNLNLLTLGLRTAGALPERSDSLKAAIKVFRSAKDRATADQALVSVRGALAAFRAVADTAVQKKP